MFPRKKESIVLSNSSRVGLIVILTIIIVVMFNKKALYQIRYGVSRVTFAANYVWQLHVEIYMFFF